MDGLFFCKVVACVIVGFLFGKLIKQIVKLYYDRKNNNIEEYFVFFIEYKKYCLDKEFYERIPIIDEILDEFSNGKFPKKLIEENFDIDKKSKYTTTITYKIKNNKIPKK